MRIELPKEVENVRLEETEGTWVLTVTPATVLTVTPATQSTLNTNETTPVTSKSKSRAEYYRRWRANRKNATNATQNATNATQNATQNATNATQNATNATQNATNATQNATNATCCATLAPAPASVCLEECNINNINNIKNIQSIKQTDILPIRQSSVARNSRPERPGRTKKKNLEEAEDSEQFFLDLDYPLPEDLNSEAICAKFQEWIRHRKYRWGANRISVASCRALFETLRFAKTMGGEAAVLQTLEYSIREKQVNRFLVPDMPEKKIAPATIGDAENGEEIFEPPSLEEQIEEQERSLQLFLRLGARKLVQEAEGKLAKLRALQNPDYA